MKKKCKISVRTFLPRAIQLLLHLGLLSITNWWIPLFNMKDLVLYMIIIIKAPMDPFSLILLFFYVRPHDVLMGIFLLFFRYLCLRLHVHKNTFERSYSLTCSSITWSEMGKQNIQAMKVYSNHQEPIVTNSAIEMDLNLVSDTRCNPKQLNHLFLF